MVACSGVVSESESASKVGLRHQDWTKNNARASSIRCNKMRLFVTCDYRRRPIVHLLLNLGCIWYHKSVEFFLGIHLCPSCITQVLESVSKSESGALNFLNPGVGVGVGVPPKLEDSTPLVACNAWYGPYHNTTQQCNLTWTCQ